MRFLFLMMTSLSVACCASKKPVATPAAPPPEIVIELRVVDENVGTQQPATESAVPATLSVNAYPGQPFSGSTQVGDATISVSGSFQALADGRYRTRIHYANESPTGRRAVQSTVELALGEEFALTGLEAEPGTEKLLLRLTPAR